MDDHHTELARNVDLARKALHQINNDLSIVSVALQLIAIKLEEEPDVSSPNTDLRHSCTSAIEAVKRAGQTAHKTLHQISDP